MNDSVANPSAFRTRKFCASELYFCVSFVDEECKIPTIETMRFVNAECEVDGAKIYYFTNVESNELNKFDQIGVDSLIKSRPELIEFLTVAFPYYFAIDGRFSVNL